MPTTLEFPVRRPKPEISLDKLLSQHNISSFGKFRYWDANIIVGVNSKWSNTIVRAKIDTGASISLFPEYLLEDLNIDTEKEIPYEFYGVVRKEVCKLEVKLLQIDIKIRDYKHHELDLQSVWTAFTSLEGVPVLLGYKDALERLIINQDADSGSLMIQKR